MSWWDDEDDVLGDGPADKLKAAWRSMLALRRAQGRALPSTDQALQSFAAALRSSDLDGGFSTLLLLHADAQPISFTGSGNSSEFTEILIQAIAAIAEDYSDQVNRLPRASELVKTLAFILLPRPQTYLSDADEAAWCSTQLCAK